MPRSLINIIQDPSKAEARRLLGYKKKELPSYGQEEFETVKYKVGEQKEEKPEKVSTFDQALSKVQPTPMPIMKTE